MTTAQELRNRARADLVAAIQDAASRQLAEVGPAAISLRAVARELGLVSSALYRYFPSRDALLTALIVQGYDRVGEVAEHADATARAGGAEPGERWLAVCRAVRAWAYGSPHEYALLYGSPVPGYAAPADTVAPAVRLSKVMAGVVVDAVRGQQLLVPRQPLPGPSLVTPAVLEIAGGAPPEPYADALERSLVLLVALIGALTYQLFGHLEGAVTDGSAWFDRAMTVAAEGVGLVVPAPPRTVAG